ncbi:MAG: hypothetical protein BWY49_00276 [Candidatus Omnitrophica bacterium ADurb.Bin314]|nr:MAG: hypothetical protein BWY49_00276 [Candidatus Omnitrophica bacterium ADurb.Bin314]
MIKIQGPEIIPEIRTDQEYVVETEEIVIADGKTVPLMAGQFYALIIERVTHMDRKTVLDVQDHV